MPVGTVVFAKIGAAIALNRRGIADVPLIADNNVMGVLPKPSIVPRFLYWFMRTVKLETLAQSTTVPSVRKSDVEQLPLSLPPINEQRRIVAKLDAIFEQTRAAKARLEQLPGLFGKLKRSILAAAFRGDLTADWRLAHPVVEPATALFERIRVERGRRWEEDLRAKGKEPKTAAYEEPMPLNAIDLPTLPTGWTWAPLELLLRSGGLAYGVLKPGSHVPNGVPMLRVMDFNDDSEMTGTELARISPDLHAEFARTRLEVGDVLLSVMATIGRTMVVPPELAGGNVNRAIAVLKPLSTALHSEFLVGVFGSPHFRKQVVEQTLGTAQPRINLGDVARFPVPVPPLEEQAEIVRRLKQLVTSMRLRQISVDRAAQRMSQVEAAVLAKAFRGGLVDQNTDDEPAAALLERNRAAAEHAVTKNGAKPTRTTTKRALAKRAPPQVRASDDD